MAETKVIRKNSGLQCFICEKTFKEKSKLNRHMLVHTGEKSYVCSICEKGFSVDYNLKTHMRVHTGERPFKCDYENCEKSFAQSGNLKTHMLSKHSLKIPQKKILNDFGIEEVQFIKFNSLICKALNKL